MQPFAKMSLIVSPDKVVTFYGAKDAKLVATLTITNSHVAKKLAVKLKTNIGIGLTVKPKHALIEPQKEVLITLKSKPGKGEKSGGKIKLSYCFFGGQFVNFETFESIWHQGECFRDVHDLFLDIEHRFEPKIVTFQPQQDQWNQNNVNNAWGQPPPYNNDWGDGDNAKNALEQDHQNEWGTEQPQTVENGGWDNAGQTGWDNVVQNDQIGNGWENAGQNDQNGNGWDNAGQNGQTGNGWDNGGQNGNGWDNVVQNDQIGNGWDNADQNDQNQNGWDNADQNGQTGNGWGNADQNGNGWNQNEQNDPNLKTHGDGCHGSCHQAFSGNPFLDSFIILIGILILGIIIGKGGF